MKYINAGQFQEFTLDLSDREIYNDIRSECDIIAIIDVRPDATPEFFDSFRGQGTIRPLAPGATQEVTINPRHPDHIEIRWQDIVQFAYSPQTQYTYTQEQCEALGGFYRPHESPPGCDLPSTLVRASARIVQRSDRYCVVEVTASAANEWNIYVLVQVEYLALTPGKRFIKLRSYDAESILKYGRRVMDLVWPLGQHPNQMQAILDNYLLRHKEPVVFANMLMMGKDRETTELALDLDINDRVQLTHPILNINEQFFVENLDCLHDINGTLEAYIDFQQVRDEERLRLFRLACDDDYEYEPIEGCESECVVGSLLDGDDVLAP